MTHDDIERIVGRLLADEAFRRAFMAGPELRLASIVADGAHLSPAEIAGILDTDMTVWVEAAECLDPRLQKVALTWTGGAGPPAGRS